MKELIRKFVKETLERNNQNTEFGDDDSLIRSNLFDSLDVVDLQLFIETKFGIPPTALGDDISQIDTLNNIINYIEQKIDIYKS